MTSYAPVNEAASDLTPTTNGELSVMATTLSQQQLASTPTTHETSVSNLSGQTMQYECSARCKTLQDAVTTPGSINSPSDCESYSDGHEKTDTTPENLKKIDDVIEQPQRQQQQQLHYEQQRSAATARRMHGNDSGSFVDGIVSGFGAGIGLAAAIDDSNAKFCLAKPSSPRRVCNEKDALCSSSNNSERLESSNNRQVDCSITPTTDITRTTTATALTMPVSSNSNNNTTRSNPIDDSTDNGLKADTPTDDSSIASNTNTTTTTTATSKQSYAFTIDNFNEKDCDPAAAAAKYKSMLERFQNRHRRGASMSKLESEDGSGGVGKGESSLTSSASATPLSSLSSRNSRNTTDANSPFEGSADVSTPPKVKLRARDRSTSRVRDASKRHSWSPRSSTLEPAQQQPHQQQPTQTGKMQNASATTGLSISGRKSASKAKPPPLQMPKGAANLVANRTQFTPRSTAMQLALQKVDFLCPQPPLADFKHLNADADNVSEAGTYTLDGDNYTEEQKDLMNIDKNARAKAAAAAALAQRPKQLSLEPAAVETTKVPLQRTSNVLEVNYYHDTPTASIDESSHFKYNPAGAAAELLLSGHETAGAYLEKIKSRVLRNMSATKNPPTAAVESVQKSSSTEEEDMGCFTSVTTSGVLAKQSALDPRPKLTRKSSLSTSQIDSSEYISNETKLKNPSAAAYAAGGFTDHQKAEYRLNLFTNQKDTTTTQQQKFAATRSYIESPPDTPSGKLSDAAGLKTAQTKNDWIQEWARNARARSLATETAKSRQQHQHDLMTRSYTCASDTGGGGDSSLTDDSIYSKQIAAAKLNKTLAERYRLVGDCDYSSDPTLSSNSYSKSSASQDGICKPPKSPSKIPSPLHSLGRARSASRSRAPLQNVLHSPDEEENYLQKTAAAINNLQQSLSRKNSLKSPTHSGSPRAHSARAHVMYSPEGGCSPQHSLGSPTALTAAAYHRSPLHQRQQRQMANFGALMTSSFNEQQLQLLTSGEYLVKQMRIRKNSFDGNVAQSPVRRAVAQVAQEMEQNQQGQTSPLRRSSSFSAKIATQRAARPQFQNIYTPPAARQNYTLTASSGQQQQKNAAANAIKKSASSNNFCQVYSDYDDHLQYYINDEDDMVDEYYSSGGEDDVENNGDGALPNVDGDNSAVPLSNTRYNKALLMRIERSKQKVAGGKVALAPSGISKVPLTVANSGAGLIACPNTPELPRRGGIKSAPRARGCAPPRQSMPRDTSLNRLASQVPNSLASAKKQLLQTAAAVPSTTKISNTSQRQNVQPKYLDISKYKPAQGNNFLRKNDSKSTLKTPSNLDAMKRSPSSSSMGLTRGDPSRASNRSVRSVASCMTTSGTSLGSGRATSAARRDASVSKQKEAEMAMWKRRSTYDPMKAAAEDRRKKEEAKRMALLKSSGDMPCERPSRSPYRRGQL